MLPWCLILSSLIITAAFNVDNLDNVDDEIVADQGVTSWQKPGCHRIGFTKRINIPNCVAFLLTTNACRGYCESWSHPASWRSLMRNPLKALTTTGQCCNIMETEFVTVRVMCVGGPRDFSFKSAKSCDCFHCKYH